MAMLNRPLTPEELTEALNTLAAERVIWDRLWRKICGPKYQFVRYDACRSHAVYEQPDTFYIREFGPTESRWMVPSGLGALEM